MSAEFRSRLVWRFAFGIAAVAAPGTVWAIVVSLVEGTAQKPYFEAVSQILPVLLLALAVEQRYFTRPQVVPESPLRIEVADRQLKELAARWYTRLARAYALLVLFLLGSGEWIAVEVLATGESASADLKMTAGSLAAGFTALIVSALVGTKQTAE